MQSTGIIPKMTMITRVTDTKHKHKDTHCTIFPMVEMKLHNPLKKKLTSGVPVEKERILELEIQIFGNGLCSIFHAQPIHNGEPMLWRSRPNNDKGWEKV